LHHEVVHGVHHNVVLQGTVLLALVLACKMIQECYKSVTRALHVCYTCVTGVLQECYKSVTRVLQECYKRTAKRSRVSQECFKSVTRVVQECNKSVTRMLQECYKSVTATVLARLVSRKRAVLGIDGAIGGLLNKVSKGCQKSVKRS
jgi:hypothetical protein